MDSWIYILIATPFIILLCASKYCPFCWLEKKPPLKWIIPKSKEADSSWNYSVYIISLLMVANFTVLRSVIIKEFIELSSKNTKDNKRLSKEQKILSKLISKFHIEKSPDKKWWWIIREPNVLVCEVYTKKDSEQIMRLLSFD